MDMSVAGRNSSLLYVTTMTSLEYSKVMSRVLCTGSDICYTGGYCREAFNYSANDARCF